MVPCHALPDRDLIRPNLPRLPCPAVPYPNLLRPVSPCLPYLVTPHRDATHHDPPCRASPAKLDGNVVAPKIARITARGTRAMFANSAPATSFN